MRSIEVKEASRLPVMGEYDVVVVGGGVAGCAAALESVRSGEKTLLIEKQTILGGLATSGHVVIYLPLCDGYGHQVMAGIAEELLWDSVRYSYGDDLTDWQNRCRYETRFNGPAFALRLEEKLRDEGVDIMYDTLFAGAVMAGSRCEGIITENKSGRGVFLCKAVIDASGDAEVFARAGAECRTAPNKLSIWCYASETEHSVMMDGSAPEHGLKLLTLGTIDTSRGRDEVKVPYFGDTGEGVNRFVQDGHKRLLEELKNNPGTTLASLPGMAQLRMIRGLIGEYTLRKEDLSGHFDDNIGATGDWRKPAPVYEIPLRALYSAKLDNILAAGRCISTDGEAWEVTRVIPTAAMTGQAAGAAAAMICSEGKAVSELEVSELQRRLKEHGMIMDYNR